MFAKKDTIESIVAGFNETIERLEALRTRNSAAITQRCERINRLVAENNQAAAETERAAQVSHNLKKLLDL